MLIKDTEVTRTYMVTVTLADEAPEINGFGPDLDPVAFQPTRLEIMWLKMDGCEWSLQSVRVRRDEGFKSFYRTLQSYRVASFPWIADIVLETKPNETL